MASATETSEEERNGDECVADGHYKRNQSADQNDEGDQAADDVDEYGFVNYDPEDSGNLSGEDKLQENEQWAEAGFKDGLVPAAWEAAILKGVTFDSWAEFDAAIDDYEAFSGFRFSRKKKNKEVARGVCRGWNSVDPKACKVQFSARLMAKTGEITIRKVFLIHTCSSAIHKFRNGANKAKWMARKVSDIVQINPNTPLKELRETMRLFHNTSSEIWTVQRARAVCRKPLVSSRQKAIQTAKRKSSSGDRQACNAERPVKKQTQKCRRCQQSGHNARTCMYEVPPSVCAPPPLRSQCSSPSQAGTEVVHLSANTTQAGDATAAQPATVVDAWSLYMFGP